MVGKLENLSPFEIGPVHAGCRASRDDQYYIGIGVPVYQLDAVRQVPADVLDRRDAIVTRSASAAVSDADSQCFGVHSLMPQSCLATFCFCLRLTCRAIIMRCACGEPAPCMDSVR